MRRICKLPTKWPQETVILLRVLLKHTGRHLWLLDLIRLSIIWTWLVLDQVSVLRTHKDLLTEPLRAIISPLELIVVVSLLLENEVSQTPRNCHIQHRCWLFSTCATLDCQKRKEMKKWPPHVNTMSIFSFKNCPPHYWCPMISALRSLPDCLINPTWPSFPPCPLHFHKYTNSFLKYVTKYH